MTTQQPPANAVETIKAPAEDWFECTCGNNPAQLGFALCTPAGDELDPEDDAQNAQWDGKHLLCVKCGRILDQDTRDEDAQTVNVVGHRAAVGD